MGERALTAPVMMTVLPAWLNSGLEGSMAAYVSLCQVAVGDGNGGCIFTEVFWEIGVYKDKLSGKIG
jgi:hypothetical protein